MPCADTLNKSPNKSRVSGNLGGAYVVAQDYEKAAGHLERAIRLDPFNAQAYFSYSSVLKSRRDFKTAFEYALRAYALKPDNAVYARNVGYIYLKS